MHTLSKEFEMVDEILHTGFHALTLGWCYLVIICNHRTGIIAQPLHTLADDAVAFAHFLDAHQIAVIAIPIGAYRHIKLRSEEHTSELQSRGHLVCRLL